MSTALVIAARELRERSRLFIIAAVAALVPFAVSLVPSASGQRDTVIVMAGAFLSIAFGTGLALVLGASTICGDLAEKRMSFYFAKPITPASLWAGKAIAALLISFASLAIIGVPAFLAAGSAWKGAVVFGGGRIALFATTACVALFLVSHVLSTMIRSRSLLVALDFVLTIATLFVVGMLVRPLIAGGGARFAAALVAGLSIAMLVVLAIAPVWQLANGRTDLRRSHAALSKFLWPAVGVALVLAAGFVMWVVSVSPASLVESVRIEQASGSGGVFVVGRGPSRGDYFSSFIVNTQDGSHVRIESPPWDEVRWSRDGRVAAWIQPASYFPRIEEFELYTREMGAKRSVATGIRVGMLSPFALSDDGSRVAIVSNKTVSVHDLRQKRVLASAAGITERYAAVFFVTPDLVRVIDRKAETMGLHELDVRKRSLTKTGERAVGKGFGVASMMRDGSRVLIRPTGEIADGRTGAAIAKIASSSSYGAAMLSDGSVIDPVRVQDGVRLRMFTRDGALRGEISLPGMHRAFLTAETSDGKIIVTATATAMVGETWTTYVIDRTRGTVERAVKNVRAPIPNWHDDPRVRQHEAGTPFAALDENRKLVLLDLRTGATRRLGSHL